MTPNILLHLITGLIELLFRHKGSTLKWESFATFTELLVIKLSTEVFETPFENL